MQLKKMEMALLFRFYVDDPMQLPTSSYDEETLECKQKQKSKKAKKQKQKANGLITKVSFLASVHTVNLQKVNSTFQK